MAAEITVAITLEERSRSLGKLADAEVCFHAGPLAGLRLVGFGVWAKGGQECRVTMPARQYSIGGERRAYALLRPATGDADYDALRAAILRAYAEAVTAAEVASCATCESRGWLRR